MRLDIFGFGKILLTFMQELNEFLIFIKNYLKARIMGYAHSFEKVKDVIVAFLIVKRGKYSQSFLNTSFFLLVASALIGGPIIAENSPFLGDLSQNQKATQAAIVSYNPYGNSLSTVVSAKPRDSVVDYQVVGGDTLASIAKKFDVSVDSIKWASNIKTDVIKPGQSLKVPPVTGVVYKVGSGDTIYSIAKKFKTDAQKILNFPFNDFADLDTFALSSGQTLYVPDGILEEEQPKYTTSQYYAQAQAGVRGSSNFIWPTSGMITQYPVWYHMALDIANPGAPPVLASDTGTVTYSGCLSYGYGCHIIIDHGNGYQTLYGHMSSLIASAGQVVSQGQTIGIMGSTGMSSGTHLHFEIRSGGALRNPLSYLK